MKFSLHHSVCYISSNAIPVGIDIYNTLKIMQQEEVNLLDHHHIATTEI